jgi:hypothetical protein
LPALVEEERCKAGAGALHAHQPFAVRRKAESGGIIREILILIAIEEEGVLVVLVEHPELVGKALVAAVFGVLLDLQRVVGRLEYLGVVEQLHVRPGPCGPSRHRGECGEHDKSNSKYPAAAHRLIQSVCCAWDSRYQPEVQSKDMDKA